MFSGSPLSTKCNLPTPLPRTHLSKPQSRDVVGMETWRSEASMADTVAMCDRHGSLKGVFLEGRSLCGRKSPARRSEGGQSPACHFLDVA